MVETSMNIFDLGVLIIVGLSALLSFFRGFVSEILSLGGWLVASVVTLRFLEPATEYLKPHIGNASISVAVASIGLFLLTLISFSLITGAIVKFLNLGERVGLLDNLIGLVFGVARGSLMVAIGFFVMTKFFTNEKDYPEAVKTAISRPYVEQCAALLGRLTPDTLDKIMDKKEDTSSDDIIDDEDVEKSKKHMNELIQKWDKKAKDKLEEVVPEEDLPAASLPSIEDLQKRIKEENEKR